MVPSGKDRGMCLCDHLVCWACNLDRQPETAPSHSDAIPSNDIACHVPNKLLENVAYPTGASHCKHPMLTLTVANDCRLPIVASLCNLQMQVPHAASHCITLLWLPRVAPPKPQIPTGLPMQPSTVISLCNSPLHNRTVPPHYSLPSVACHRCYLLCSAGVNWCWHCADPSTASCGDTQRMYYHFIWVCTFVSSLLPI